MAVLQRSPASVCRVSMLPCNCNRPAPQPGAPRAAPHYPHASALTTLLSDIGQPNCESWPPPRRLEPPQVLTPAKHEFMLARWLSRSRQPHFQTQLARLWQTVDSCEHARNHLAQVASATMPMSMRCWTPCTSSTSPADLRPPASSFDMGGGKLPRSVTFSTSPSMPAVCQSPGHGPSRSARSLSTRRSPAEVPTSAMSCGRHGGMPPPPSACA